MQADRTYGVQPRRILVLGGTGTIGRATVHALVARGHEVVCNSMQDRFNVLSTIGWPSE